MLLTDIVWFKITVQDHTSGHCLLVAVLHSTGDGTSCSQYVQIGELFFSPKPPSTVPNSSVVPKHLSQRPSIQPLKNNKPDTLARRSSANEADDVWMIQSRMDGCIARDNRERERERAKERSVQCSLSLAGSVFKGGTYLVRPLSH